MAILTVSPRVTPVSTTATRNAAPNSSGCSEDSLERACDCEGCTSEQGVAQLIHELLEAFGFPGELFPAKEVLHYRGDLSNGFYHLQLKGDVEKQVDVPGFSGLLRFASEIRGHISKGKIKKLEGVSICAWGVEVPLDAVVAGYMCKSKVYFYSGVVFSGIPISAIRTLWD